MILWFDLPATMTRIEFWWIVFTGLMTVLALRHVWRRAVRLYQANGNHTDPDRSARRLLGWLFLVGAVAICLLFASYLLIGIGAALAPEPIRAVNQRQNLAFIVGFLATAGILGIYILMAEYVEYRLGGGAPLTGLPVRAVAAIRRRLGIGGG